MNRTNPSQSNLLPLHLLSPADFAALGVNDVAYVKAVTIQGIAGYAIHAADGTPLTVMAHRDVAFAAALQFVVMAAVTGTSPRGQTAWLVSVWVNNA